MKQTLTQRLDDLERYASEAMQRMAERIGYIRGTVDALEMRIDKMQRSRKTILVKSRKKKFSGKAEVKRIINMGKKRK